MGHRGRRPTIGTRQFASNRAPVERAREGSPAKSIQRMSVLWAVLYRVTTALAWYANAQRARIQRREDRRWKILRRRAPSFWLPREQLRARSCSIGSQMAVAQALPAGNETDKRFVFRALVLQSRQTSNDSKLPATKKWCSKRSQIVRNSVAPLVSSELLIGYASQTLKCFLFGLQLVQH